MATTVTVALQGDGEGVLARRMHRRWDRRCVASMWWHRRNGWRWLRAD
uniref:Uncharacterized protein n=1 Tax=Arundo donax TaxID=35708 RepID=A0A0A9BSQ6_ARUDO